MGTLTRYLSRLFLARTLAVLVALTALLQLLDLLDAASDVLARGGGAGDLAYYALLRLPTIVERLVPLSVLVGTIALLWGLAQANEVTALRSAGLTPYRLVLTLLPAAGLMASAHFILGDQIAPRAERAFLSWWQAAEPPPGDAPEMPETLWFRAGGDIASATGVEREGQVLTGLTVYARDERGRTTARTTAARAEHGAGGWTLEDGTVQTVTPDGVTTQPFRTRPWEVPLHPANLLELVQPTENVPLLRLRDIVAGTWAGRESPAFYRTRLHDTYAGPLATLVMVLLAAPVAHGLRRRGGAQGGLALALSLGLVFLLVDGILSALGEAGTIPPLLAAWAPTLAFASIAGAILVHVEG